MYEYSEAQMAKIKHYERVLESNKQETRGRRYVNLNQSVFKLQFDEDFMALAYSSAKIF